MLPHRLHRAVRPPVALPPQLAERGGHLGPGPGPGGVRHLPAGPVDGHGEVGVLGQGVGADAADLVERLPTEGADGPGHDHDATERLVHPAVEVAAHDVLDVLPAAEQAPPVSHLRVAGHRPDFGVGQRSHQVADGVGLEDRVAVDHHDDVVAGGGDAGVEGGGLAAVGPPDERHSGLVEGQGLHGGGGAVGGAVVDDDHLQGRVVAAGQRPDGGGDADLLVVGGDDDAHRGERRRRRPGQPGLATGQCDERDGPSQGEDDEREDEEPQPPGHERRQVEGQQQRLALQVGKVPDRCDRRSGRQPGDARHRREPVPLALELGDEPVDGLDGLAAIAAGVVEEDDAALPRRRSAVGDDAARPGQAPVLRVLRGEDHEVAELGGPAGGGQLGGGEVGDLGGVREPQQVGADPGRPGQGALGEVQLDAVPPVRHRPQVGVGERVGPDLVPAGQLRPDELGVPGRLGADDEEGGRDAVAAQDVEDRRRPLGVRAVVERQGHRLVGQRRRSDGGAGQVEDRAGGREVGGRPGRRHGRRPADLMAGEPVEEEGHGQGGDHGGQRDPAGAGQPVIAGVGPGAPGACHRRWAA